MVWARANESRDTARRGGFTLLELSMVLVVAGLMVGFLTQVSFTSNLKDCYATTRAQLPVIKDALERFARRNDRLPFPSARNLGIEDPNYGREDNTIVTTAGVKFGALPFQALGLAPTYAGDCWSNKFTYMVTAALTSSTSPGGFLDQTVKGNIIRRSEVATATDTEVAYAVISHGADELGAVEINYSGGGAGWCATALSMRSINCRASTAEVGDAVFNDGRDAAANFFDDIVLASGKPKIAVDAGGLAVYCWGDNSDGQLGDGTTTDRTVPTKVSTNVDMRSVSVGQFHTCGLAWNGDAYCWGDNTYNEVDSTATTSRPTPTLSGTGYNFQKVAAAANTSYGLTGAGAVYCWGYNGSGECGKGDTATPVTTPALTSGGLTFADFTAGYHYACGVTQAGAGYCWGWNTYDGNRLGDGTGTDRLVPTLVSGGLTWETIKAGTTHTCGLTTAGAAYCWGDGAWGQIGDGTVNDRSAPRAVSGGHVFTDIAVGHYHTCGIKDNGSMYCWGSNSYGEQGRGVSGGITNTPQLVNGIAGIKFTKLQTDKYSTCGITMEDKIYCWGIGEDGEIGNGTSGPGTEVNIPTLVSGTGTYPLLMSDLSESGLSDKHRCALNNVDYLKRLTSSNHIGWSLIYVRDNREIWGLDVGGTSYSNFIKMSMGADDYVTSLGRWYGMRSSGNIEVSDGGYPWASKTNIGGRVKANFSDGVVYSLNAYNRVLYTDSPTYHLSDAGIYARYLGAISLGATACYIKLDGDLMCYGAEPYGELGNGAAGGPGPVAVSGGGKWLMVDGIGKFAFCGLKSDRTLWCWGRNNVGQLGLGDTANRNTPVQVGTAKWLNIAGARWSSSAPSLQYACGVTLDGEGYCWGEGTASNLGSAGGSSTSPRLVAGGRKWLAIVPDGNTTCGVTRDREVWCWGSDGGYHGFGATPIKKLP